MSSQFLIEIVQESELPAMEPQSALYSAVASQEEESLDLIDLQSQVKTYHVLLEYEQKRKNERIKEIEYGYINAFNNYLWTKHDSHVILNSKDLINLDDNLEEELRKIQGFLFRNKDISLIASAKPSAAFLNDFMNYFPNWQTYITSIIALEVNNNQSIQSTFESEYTLPSRFISSLRLSDKIKRFCKGIFEQPLKELCAIKEQLTLDFIALYEKWNGQTKTNILSQFFHQNIALDHINLRLLKRDLERLYGNITDEACLSLIQEADAFAQENTALAKVSSQFEELSFEICNLRLFNVVQARIIHNQKLLQGVVRALVSEIVRNFNRFPREIKFVVKEFLRLGSAKYGELKFEDLKSFFNKVIFSQLLFAEFMQMHEAENSLPCRDFNITMVALVSQKVMFGQQFYQKDKYGSFNQLISQFSEPIKTLIGRFSPQDVQGGQAKQFECSLVSLETLKDIYESLRINKAIEQLPSVEEHLMTKQTHSIGSSRYPLKSIFLILVEKPIINYSLVLKPCHKLKRTLINFLLLIDRIPTKTSTQSLLEQYKHCEEESIKPTVVQLYANYLSLKEIPPVINSIRNDIETVNASIEAIKILLQKEHNYVINLQAMHMKHLKDKKRRHSEKQVSLILDTIHLPLNYQIINEKVCEGAKNGQKPLKDCISDVAEYYISGYEGADGLYHHFIEKTVQEIEARGVADQEMISSAKKYIGTDLCRHASEHMKKSNSIAQSKKKHWFVNLSMLGLKVYADEESLILQESLLLFSKLNAPQSADSLLQILYEVTVVFSNVIGTTGKTSDITTDVQIPLMILVVLRGNVDHLGAIVDFIEKFSCEDLSSSVMGLTLTLVKSVVYLVETMDAKALSLTPQQYIAQTQS